MRRRYTMREGSSVAQRAAAEIEAWLRSLRQTVAVRNVEADPAYQRIDVDLLWTTRRKTYKVEIKADRYKTSNFFFETQSNKEKQTPGCFLYTEADLLFYYFIEKRPKLLYVLPMPATRTWFLDHLEEFDEAETQTPVGDGEYTTVGRLVPIACVKAGVENVRIYTLPS